MAQILVVMGIIAILAVMVVGVFGRGRTTARRAQCDVKLKTIALALDYYRQEKGRYPATLAELRAGNYLQESSALHCTSDPDPNGTYENYYAIRGPRDKGDLPIVVCPFHERDSKLGPQAYVGRYTKQFATVPAHVDLVRDATVTSPGKSAISATVGQELHGGDLITTGATGSAVIRFTDGSTTELKGGSSVTVLQSFMEGQASAPLYTMVRQSVGDVIYRVHPGSKFDVVTPTATAGALGTVFEIKEFSPTTGAIICTEGKVRLSTTQSSVIIPNDVWVPLNWTKPAPPIATPVPTPTALPLPTPVPIPTPCVNNGGNGQGCANGYG